MLHSTFDALVIVAAFVLLGVDWLQTLVIARNPQRWREGWNLILPEHPSVEEVSSWFAAVAILAAVALWLLPELRLVIALVGGAVEAACVVNNYRHGIRV